MGSPVRVAFCPLLFARNGGTFDSRGLPIFNDPEETKEDSVFPARGKCDQACDCGLCPLLQVWVEARQVEGFNVGWECSECLQVSWEYERRNPEVQRVLPGYYQSGRKNDPEAALDGCTSCGKETSFLQLVLRRAR